MRSAPPGLTRRLALPLDVLVVLIFVAIGRSAHAHGINLGGLASTTWPFAVGLGAAWLVLRWRGRPGLAIADGALADVVTVAVGMVLRVVSGQGTPVAFVVVALCFLGAGMVGWRLLARLCLPVRRAPG
jgi:hypothetical protein